MKVYAVIGSNWNIECGYNEYSKPIKIKTNKKEAESLAASLKNALKDRVFDDYIVEEYTLS
ncbi:hypothetical protein AVV36_gp152 [Pectobacterium bacteriophage PM2]|uniref:Uncharacterized protein n=1 Tax=Pectobacterium bacteriophage PM2 TaxID=1429794 RepID=A0A0A0PZI3_9CAUD|nr:hypothetical protein AVV36_gp152 [Pectobacterium bacteriophage PM2]AHY25114.1 hypothetical protein PM2_152 [Pectobacterium bacteriophage PM2]